MSALRQKRSGQRSSEPRHTGILGPLGRRVAAGSLVIALGSIAVLAIITLIFLDFDLGSAGREQENSSRSAIAAAVRSAYLAQGSWAGADLLPAKVLAELQGVGLTVQTPSGETTTLTESAPSSRVFTLAVDAHGSKVGTLRIAIPASGLSPEEQTLRKNLVNGIAIAAAVAAVLALSAAVFASRRIVAPIRTLTAAAGRFGAGERSTRVGSVRAPGELGQLARAFDNMASDLEREDELRRALVADVAHELRTPLAILRAHLEAVSQGLTDLSQATVDSLTEEVQRLGRLVDDLGVLAAAQAAALRLERRPVDLADVASVATERLAHRFVDREISLVSTLESARVMGDAGRLEQATVNLLSNAEKFSSPGSEVRIEVHRDGPHAELSVSDDGPGIPPAEQRAIFDRFYRSAGARVTTTGSGVGLAVVSEIVRAHDGWIELQSSPGHGSTFRLLFPALP